MDTKIVRVNIALLLAYTLAPLSMATVAAALYMDRWKFASLEIAGIIFSFVLMAMYFFTVAVVSPILYSIGGRRFKKYCTDNGCMFDNFFYGRTSYAAIDSENKVIGLLFRFNPTIPYMVSLDNVKCEKTSDEKYIFFVDGQEIKLRSYDSEMNMK